MQLEKRPDQHPARIALERILMIKAVDIDDDALRIQKYICQFIGHRTCIGSVRKPVAIHFFQIKGREISG